MSEIHDSWVFDGLVHLKCVLKEPLEDVHPAQGSQQPLPPPHLHCSLLPAQLRCTLTVVTAHLDLR